MSKAAKQINNISDVFSAVEWQQVTIDMDEKGYALVPGVLPDEMCDEFIRKYDDYDYRKTVTMERHRFGLGEYKYFEYPLPAVVQTAREEVYPRLAPIANAWSELLNMDMRFPDTFRELQERCR